MAEEARELNLLDNVHLKIVGTSSRGLTTLLDTYLLPLLLKAGSPYAKSRAKLIGICKSLLDTYIKPPEVVLPVAKLVDRYKQSDSPLEQYFLLEFAVHSLDRLDIVARRELVARTVTGIALSNATHKLFGVVLNLLPDIDLSLRGSQEDEALRKVIGLSEPRDAVFLSTWLGKLILFRFSASSPGLTKEDDEFLQNALKKAFGATNAKDVLRLYNTKIKAVQLLASGAFTDEERLMPSICAAGNTDSRISVPGEDMLRRSTISVEDDDTVRKLFDGLKTLPPQCCIRILKLLTRSELSTTYHNEIREFMKRTLSAESEENLTQNNTRSTGLELKKIQQASFEYLNWVARIGPRRSGFSDVARPLLDLVNDVLGRMGCPIPQPEISCDPSMRAKLYEAMGSLVKGIKFETDAALVPHIHKLFSCLSCDPTPDVAPSIEGALAGIASKMQPPLSESLTDDLHGILISFMQREPAPKDSGIARSTQYAVTKWANRVLPFSDMTARWINVMASAGSLDQRRELVEEGQRGLDPLTYYSGDGQAGQLPDWIELVHLFLGDEETPGYRDLKLTVQQLPAYTIAVEYCNQMLFLAALKGDFDLSPDWQRKLETVVSSNKSSRDKIRQHLGSTPSVQLAVLALLNAAFQGATAESKHFESTFKERCTKCLADVLSLTPGPVVEGVVLHLQPDDMSRANDSIYQGKKEHQLHAAKVYGILAAHPAWKEAPGLINIDDDIKRRATQVVGAELHTLEGVLVAEAHYLSRKAYYSGGFEVSGIPEYFSLDEFSSCPLSLQEAICLGYTQLWTAGIKTPKKMTQINATHTRHALLEPLVALVKRGNEKAIKALGRLPIAWPDQHTAGNILEKLYALSEIKGAEVQFTVGEAIAAAVCRWDSQIVELDLDVELGQGWRHIGRDSPLLQAALDKLLQNSKETKPSLLKASGIWLFSLIQHCSHLPEIQNKMRECQVAFMRLLGARDDLVQETASRGLALVYDKGDSELQAQLVRDLVSAFTGSGHLPQLKVEDETELFEAGALPTGEGKSVTSYKDIVSLANEVGDQSLVYKLMGMANNAATWSARSAFGRFGLSNILSSSEIDPKVYPKLFRYRFDPNLNVKRSMEDIWRALVKDSNAVVERHFDAILQDLLKSIYGKEFRVREASCAAITDLIAIHPFQKYEQYYADIWKAALKVLDDVKGSVRQAALKLCLSLSNKLVRQLEASDSTAAKEAMMKEALPFLLSENGIESGVEEVQAVSIITVTKISKKGGKLLRPHIPTMIPRLLGLLSTIEPEAINYYYQRAGEESREKLDRLRSTSVSQGPIVEAIEDCLRFVDADVLKEFAPHLRETVTSAVGMPTKIGCGRVLTTLAIRHREDFKPYARRFLQMMEKELLDRNAEVSSHYARTAACIMRVVPEEAKLAFVLALTNLYLSSENDTRRSKVADATSALSSVSPDEVTALETQILPFVYLGAHDTDDALAKQFAEIWDTHTGGSSLAVARYIPEIVALVERSLDTAQWALRHAAALTVANGVSAVLVHADIQNLRALWNVYEKALALKAFAGKEMLLEPFPAFVKKGRVMWEDTPAFAAQLRKIALREAKRNNAAYRPHAFRCLWRFAEAAEVDILEDIVAVVGDFWGEENEAEKMDVDGEYMKGTAWAAIEAVARGFSRGKMEENALGELGRVRGYLTGKIEGEKMAGVRRESWYACVGEVFEEAARGAVSKGQGAEEELGWWVSSLDLARAGEGTEAQRMERARAMGKVLGFWKRTGEGEGPALEVVRKAIAEERSDDVREVWRGCL